MILHKHYLEHRIRVKTLFENVEYHIFLSQPFNIIHEDELYIYLQYVVLNIVINSLQLALLKAQVSLQLGKVFISDNGVSVSIMYSYT